MWGVKPKDVSDDGPEVLFVEPESGFLDDACFRYLLEILTNGGVVGANTHGPAMDLELKVAVARSPGGFPAIAGLQANYPPLALMLNADQEVIGG